MDDHQRLRKCVEANLVDAENALLLLPPGMSPLRDYINSIRFNCQRLLRDLDNDGMWAAASDAHLPSGIIAVKRSDGWAHFPLAEFEDGEPGR